MATNHRYDLRALTVARRKNVGRRGSGLTARVKAAIDALVAGEANTYEEACQVANLSTRALRLALHKPEPLAYYRKELEALKDMERVRSLRKLISIRDDAELSKSAAGAKAQIESVKALHDEPGGGGRGPGSVNIQINAATGEMRQQVSPGYVVLSRHPISEIKEKLRAAGSVASVLDEPGAVQVIEDAEWEDVSPVPPARGPHSMPGGS